MSDSLNKINLPDYPSKYKIRVHAKVFLLTRRDFPKTVVNKSDLGLISQSQEWYDEHDLGEYAINHNHNSIPNRKVKEFVGALAVRIIQALERNGLISR